MLITLGTCPDDEENCSGIPAKEMAEQFHHLLQRWISKIGQEENEDFKFSIRHLTDELYDVIMQWNEKNDGAVRLAEWVLDTIPSNWDDEVE